MYKVRKFKTTYGNHLLLRAHCENNGRRSITSRKALTRWRHQMEIFSALLALCVGNSRWIPLTKTSDAEFWCLLWSDVIKWQHFRRYWPFVRGIRRSPVDSTHKGQWRRVLMFSLICARTNGSAKNQDAGDLRSRDAHYDVTMTFPRTAFNVLWIDVLLALTNIWSIMVKRMLNSRIYNDNTI